ncbi:hypothetical protein [Chryseobacterium sp.]|uniref:hypothetical protein n=1 Tax=Chryseobacterium sp. TaxID=1871047 RepID=UPI000ED6BF35|nr:hypothetical protein [Chryseobacterium sp.]HCA06933.1 hypothetical protein [Chryseobacterium sp.]
MEPLRRFIIRVELHKADATDYQILYDAMKEAEFVKTIKKFNSNNIYKLPEGEYHYSSKKVIEAKDVLDIAIKAVAKTKKEYQILVTKADGAISFIHLTPDK